MERVSENIYEWTGHRELTEKDRKYLAELKKDTEGVFGEPIDEKEAIKLTKKEHLTGQDLQNHIDSKIASRGISYSFKMRNCKTYAYKNKKSNTIFQHF